LILVKIGLSSHKEDPLDRIRIKARQYFQGQVTREDVERGFTRKGEHLFYRLSMRFSEALTVYDSVVAKLDSSPLSKEVEITNLQHPQDTQEFLFLYNSIFLAAPDPTRPITMEDAISFPSDRTFIAKLWQSMAGFIYLVIEKDPLGSGESVGAIAGIGVLPKYRGRKIGLTLLKHAIDYFRDKDVKQLICEVYYENEASLHMFKGLGMKTVGEMILEDVQINQEVDKPEKDNK
jgi:ribosomal protein S18 acetylase RimI-like enzyme